MAISVDSLNNIQMDRYALLAGRYEMPANTLARWLAALRGDRYQQIRGKLEDGPGSSYVCTLGVLVRTLNPQEHINDHVLINKYKVPELVLRAVVCMNDSLGQSFAQIAEWLENHVTPVNEPGLERLKEALIQQPEVSKSPYYKAVCDYNAHYEYIVS